jgi:two-component system LytT family response regulator/two-component system response regulator LytT
VTERLRVAIVDDEPIARQRLRRLLRHEPAVEIVAECGDGRSAITAIQRYAPDLLFLDIQMPELDGFGVLRALSADRLPAVVFVTAFDQYAIDAFEVNAVDYLLKPVDPARLEVAVQRARRRTDFSRAGGEQGAGSGVSNAQLEKIVQLVAERQSRRERLAIKVGERFLLVQADEIIYASLADENITVVTPQHTGTSNYRTLDELQARLDPAVFWRVHRSHLVNINKIKEIVPWFSRNYILRMKDAKATEIPVSRTQTRRLREYLKL